MVGLEFFDFLKRFELTTHVGVEDFSDKLNSLYSVVVYLICLGTVAMKQHFGKPISCYIATP